MKNILIQLPKDVKMQMLKVVMREMNELMEAHELKDSVEDKVRLMYNAVLDEKKKRASDNFFLNEKIKELTEVIQRNAARKS